MEGILLSCRICQSIDPDNDPVCLFLLNGEEMGKVSEAGMLYEELMGVTIDSETIEQYPQYLCNSCDLQIKLFKKLKVKALKTLEFFAEIYSSAQLKAQEAPLENTTDAFDTNVETVYTQTEEIPQESCHEVTQTDLGGLLSDELNFTEPKSLSYEDVIIETDEETTGAVVEDVLFNKPEEIYGLFDEQSTSDVSSASSIFYTDICYLEEANEYENKKTNATSKSKKKSVYKCRKCVLEFTEESELKEHRKAVHTTQMPCPKCSKVLNSADSLRVHMQLHEAALSYKCDLCGKSFNQKVHYKYHVDKHNNIRNFKCDDCDKAYISKADLAIHMRTHTGERRYCCDLCDKDFLLYQHLKMHRYSHFAKSFECEICQQKFVSPLTLRTHVKNIHIMEPSFQCELCGRKFRRKHHLQAHQKTHEKQNVNYDYSGAIDNNFSDFIDDPVDINNIYIDNSIDSTILQVA